LDFLDSVREAVDFAKDQKGKSIINILEFFTLIPVLFVITERGKPLSLLLQVSYSLFSLGCLRKRHIS